MHVETQDYASVLVEPEAHLEESYDLLEEGLSEFLRSPARGFDLEHVDYLEALRTKVAFAQARLPHPEQQSKLAAILDRASGMVRSAIKKMYDGCVDPERVDSLTGGNLALVYGLLVLDRRGKAVDSLVAQVCSMRQALAEGFKKESKKDFLVARLEEELGDFVNPKYAYIVANYRQIFDELISDDEGDLKALLVDNHELTFQQSELLSQIFMDNFVGLPYEKFFADLRDHPELPHVAADFRDALVEKLRKLQ